MRVLRLFLSAVLLLCSFGSVLASEKSEYFEAKVIRQVAYGYENSVMGERVEYQVVEVEVVSENRRGDVMEIKNTSDPMYLGEKHYEKYNPGDVVTLTMVNNVEGEEEFHINGKLRRPGLVRLVILFVLVVLVVGRVWGALSLLGLVISFAVIFVLIVPMIMSGRDPVWASVLGSMIIIPSTFYVSHGFNKKTHVGVVSTLLVLLFTGILAESYVRRTFLTGLASEEAGFLGVAMGEAIDIKGLLIAGIIIGSLGILDDITVGQASVVQQLKIAHKKVRFSELFWQGMKVGQDHISSMVNTLVLVYSGSALPLILLFFDSNRVWIETLEMEIIAEEVVRMLVGSIGLVVAAPIATAMAAWVFSNDE